MTDHSFNKISMAEHEKNCCVVLYIGLFGTLKPGYNEPRYSEFRDIVNKTQLPFSGFTKHITSDIVNYSI